MDGNLYLKDMTGAAIGTAANPLVVYATGSTGVSSLSALTDVLIVTPASGQSLLYSATDSKWHNGSIAGSGDMMKSAYATVSESTVDNSFALNGHADTYFATANHDHNIWDLAGYATLNADTLDGYDSTYFATTGDLTGYSTTAHTHAHNDTTSKQGGTTDEYYHLTQTQNASVAAWDVATSAHNHNIWALTGYATINADTLDGEHATAFATAVHTHPATQVTFSQLNTCSYDDLEDWFDIVQSGGRISGGVLSAHSPANGTLDISQMEGFIKLSDSEVATTKYFRLAAQSGLSLTDNVTNYVYVDYNSGTPRVLVTTDRTAIRWTDQFNLGRAFRSGTAVTVLQSGINTPNRTRRVHERWIDTFGGVSYANGIQVSCTGLKPAITAGVLYAGSNRITVSATDCNAGGTFTSYYYNPTGAAWVLTASQTTLDNTYYNNASTGTGLAELTANRYGIHWIYVAPDGSLHVMYGKGDYTLAQAQAATASSPIHAYLSTWAKLAAKIIIQKSSATVYSTTMAWTTQFPVQNPGDHNTLAGLQGGQTDQYYHLNATSYASVIAWAVGGGAHNTLTGLQGGTTNEYYHLTNTQHASVIAWDVATAAHNHTGTYLPIAGKAADSELLDGQDSTYYATTGSLSAYATVAHTHATYVVGPGSALNNYYAAFDSTSGKLIKYASLYEGTNGVSLLPGQTYQINGTALTYTNVGAAAAAHTHAHNDTTSLQGGTTGEYYHLSSTSYASVAAWNVAAAASRLTAVSTSFSFATTSNDDGLLQQTVNLGANFGQIVRVRVWADQTMGQRTAGTVLINNASGIDPSTTSMAYDGLVGTLPTAGAEGAGDYIWIDNELCRVSAGTSTPLTIVRGLCGSLGAFHDDNAVVTTANDGLRIALFQTATSYPAEAILDMRKVMTGKFTTDAAITAGDKVFTLSSSPAVLTDWGYGDLGLIDDTSDEYFRVQKTYGAVAGTTYDDSVAVLNALAAHDTSKTVYRVVEYTTPIPFKFSGSATTLYLDIYAHQLLPGATTVYLEFLIDKWS